jgi:predicted nucleotidyltransferase
MKTNHGHRQLGRPDKKVHTEIVQCIVDAAQPDKLILFGSAARGEMGPDSDIDLLVVKSGKFSHERVTRNIYRNLSGRAAVDAVVVKRADLERYGDSPYLVYYPAFREGKVVYDADGLQVAAACQELDAKSTKCGRKSGRPDKIGPHSPSRRVISGSPFPLRKGSTAAPSASPSLSYAGLRGR